jgi:hypothetical protein
LNVYLFMEAVAAPGKFPTYFVVVYAVGFVAAVTLGSLAWYNSKRPVGWENTERPDFVPEIKTETDVEEDKQKS